MRRYAVLFAICLLAAGFAFAQGVKGNLEGTVIDEGGVALPGVTVILSSPNMAGTQSTITDTNGYFRFVRLPPGSYKAVFSLSGYQRVEQELIQINIGDNVRFDVTLRSAFTEEVVVTSESPLVDTTSTGIGIDLTEDFFLDLPVNRNYTSVAAVTQGANVDDSGQTFYGSTGAENIYYIDGVNTTGVELGQQGKVLNFEFIQEVQVKTGGYDAEYGRATGGIINVITKSGGNEFHGDVFGYWDDDSLQNSLKGAAIRGNPRATFRTQSYTRSDYGFDLGGFILRDKIWFFAAYDVVDNEFTRSSTQDFSEWIPGAPTEGQEFGDKTTRDLWAAKLTWRVSSNHSLAVSGFADPTDNDGILPGVSLASTPLHFTGQQETGGEDYSASYDGVFGENVVGSLRFSDHNEKFKQTGPGADAVGYVDFSDPIGDGTTVWGWVNEDDVFREAGFGFYQDQEFGREQWNADVSLFVDDLGGQHEFKFGYEWEDISVNSQNWNGGTGQRIYRFNCSESRCGTNDIGYYYRHRYFLNDPDVDPLTATPDDVLRPQGVDTKSDSQAVYLQDRWQVGPNFTLSLGLRWTQQRLYNSDQEVHADINDSYAPRLGFVWDFMGNGKSKLYGHVGRFFETIPMDIVIRSFGNQVSAFFYNYSDDPDDVAGLDYNPDGPIDDSEIGRRSSVLGGGFSRVDPGVKGQYIEEYVVGAEYEVVTDLAIGVKLIHRDLSRVIEDALAADGDYFIGNPGQGLMTGTYDIGYAYGYNEGDYDTPEDHPNFHTVPSPKRTFKGVEFTAQKRFSNNFQFMFSALISRLYGNYDGTFQASTGQLDPNLNSGYDYYDFMVNNNGYLSNDRRQQFKLDGLYRFDWGLNIGLSTFYLTGTPITAMGYSVPYNNWEYYLSKRGEFGRVDSQWEADLHLGYPIRLGGNLELNLLLDIFNLFNRQGETLRDTQYTTADDAPYLPLDWETGLSYNPITTENMADRPPTQESFNTSLQWQQPRSVRIGARLSF